MWAFFYVRLLIQKKCQSLLGLLAKIKCRKNVKSAMGIPEWLFPVSPYLSPFSVAVTKYPWPDNLQRIEVYLLSSSGDWKSKSMAPAFGWLLVRTFLLHDNVGIMNHIVRQSNHAGLALSSVIKPWVTMAISSWLHQIVIPKGLTSIYH
jgi:hypothetical protein